MPGFSLTLLLLPTEKSASDKILSLLDEPAKTPGWKWSPCTPPTLPVPSPQDEHETGFVAPDVNATLKPADPASFIDAIRRACNALIKAEPEITKMDTIAGDG
jgi:triose/dihydroxyacetone kinase / FAD-AMP lyase (cyclizing)